MKEKPILFSKNMVNAILDGRKTQTRRVVKGKWLPLVEEVMKANGRWVFDTHAGELTTPYGRPGDRLWVRESFRFDGFYDSRKPSLVPEGVTVECAVMPNAVNTEGNGHRELTYDRGKLRPSIFMPRWASRILLEVVDVRVERVQDISEEDARAEGWMQHDPRWPDAENFLPVPWFRELWNSINGKPRKDGTDISWAGNPWVWVVDFQKIPENNH